MATKKRNSYFGSRHAVASFAYTGTDSAGTVNSAIGSHGLGLYLPANAVILRAFYNVDTTFTSGGGDAATIALTVESAGDLKAAIAISAAGDVWDAGLHACLPGEFALDGNALTAIASAAARAASLVKTTAKREITVTVASQALTAGELTLVIEYIVV